jgi:hypothetical protein
MRDSRATTADNDTTQSFFEHILMMMVTTIVIVINQCTLLIKPGHAGLAFTLGSQDRAALHVSNCNRRFLRSSFPSFGGSPACS